MIIETWIAAIRTDNPNSHFAVIKTLQETGEADWWTIREGELRRFQLYRPHPNDSIIMVRFNIEPPPSLPTKKVEYELNVGDTIKLSVFLNDSHRRAIESPANPKGQFAMSHAERIHMIKRLMGQAGIEPTTVSYQKKGVIMVKSSKGDPAKRPVMDAHVIGTITDIEAFKNAILYGIGRHKTFGFGFIRFNKI